LTCDSTVSIGPFTIGSEVGTPNTMSIGLSVVRNCTGARSCTAACIV
jgi:hypothetical protein